MDTFIKNLIENLRAEDQPLSEIEIARRNGLKEGCCKTINSIYATLAMQRNHGEPEDYKVAVETALRITRPIRLGDGTISTNDCLIKSLEEDAKRLDNDNSILF